MARSPRTPRRIAALETAARILELQRPDETDRAFAKRLGLTPQTLSNYRSEVSGASVDAVARVLSRVLVDARWLILGEGTPFEKAGPSADAFDRGAESVLTETRAFLRDLERRYRDPGGKRRPEK